MTKVQQKQELSKYAQEIHKTAVENLGKYQFKSRRRNPEFDIKNLIPLRSCHIRINAESEKAVKMFLQTVKGCGSDAEILMSPEIGLHYISKTPKWLTTLEHPKCIDTGTGEIIFEDYETDDFKAAKRRKIKTVKKFCDFYEPQYQKRQISLLFHTFTRIEYSRTDMRRMLDNIKFRYKALNRPIKGFLWAIELKENEKMESGYHIHYHLVVAIKRLQVSKIPEELKFNDLWGQRTGVEFIKKSVRSYLSKYLYKSDAKILGRRAYSISRHLN
jgi:hypothetical protein